MVWSAGGSFHSPPGGSSWKTPNSFSRGRALPLPPVKNGVQGGQPGIVGSQRCLRATIPGDIRSQLIVCTKIELLNSFQALPLRPRGWSKRRASLTDRGTQGMLRHPAPCGAGGQRAAAPGQPGQTYCGARLLPATRRGHSPGPSSWRRCPRENPRGGRAPPAAASCRGTGMFWGRRVGMAHL